MGEARVGYRSFPPRLAPALTVGGGVLVVLGGLGNWIRATRVAVESGPVEEVSRLSGTSQATGWALAVLGVLTAVASVAWLGRDLLPKLLPALASAALIGFSLWRLAVLDGRAEELVGTAAADPDFVSFHAGFGWGAWFLLLAVIPLGLGVLVAALRELDLRRPETQ